MSCIATDTYIRMKINLTNYSSKFLELAIELLINNISYWYKEKVFKALGLCSLHRDMDSQGLNLATCTSLTLHSNPIQLITFYIWANALLKRSLII